MQTKLELEIEIDRGRRKARLSPPEDDDSVFVAGLTSEYPEITAAIKSHRT